LAGMRDAVDLFNHNPQRTGAGGHEGKTSESKFLSFPLCALGVLRV